MVNIIIVDKNINTGIHLMNYLNSKRENIRVCALLKDSEIAIKMLNEKENIDIVLVNNNIAQEVLSNIKDKKKYKKSCIIFQAEKPNTNSMSKSSLVYTTIYKDKKLFEIYNRINELIEEKENSKPDKALKGRITEELQYLGFNFSRKGTKYLIETINYMAINYDKYLENLERDVYPEISKMCKDTVLNVKYNIIRANNAMYYECEEEKLKEYFHFDSDIKPKVKTVINTVINNVCNYN